VPTVYEHGEFAVRGSLIDLYPMGSDLPLRIDLLDDEIDSLRCFDPETQRTLRRVDSIELLPAREFPLDRGGIRRFQQNWYARFDVDHDQCPLFTEISAGRAPGGAEYYLPLFFERCETLLDYLPPTAALVAIGDHHGAAQRFFAEATRRYDEFNIDPRRPLLTPAEVFTPVETLYSDMKRFPVLELRRHSDSPVHVATPSLPPPQLDSDTGNLELRARLDRLLEGHRGPVLLCAESAGRREILLESLRARTAAVRLLAGLRGQRRGVCTRRRTAIDRGLALGPDAPMLVTEAQLFGERVAQRRRRQHRDAIDPEAIFRDLNELRPGSPVVHSEHGVGRYLGLTHLEVDGAAAEFLTLAYADNDKLYVPVASLQLISRYSGSGPGAGAPAPPGLGAVGEGPAQGA
jgi:transcription-repair coupling factor (superfamily II helicase)